MNRGAANPRVRVLVVEDSLVVRILLTHIIARDPRLELAGAVESGEAALAAIETVRPDVISMDIRLPGIDGLETTRRIMASRPTPIVVIADSVEDSSLKISMNALRAGALSVVEKPVVEKEVVPVERVRLDKRTVTEQQQVTAEVRKEQIDTDVEGNAPVNNSKKNGRSTR